MRRLYFSPDLELLYIYAEENFLDSDQITPGIVDGDDDY